MMKRKQKVSVKIPGPRNPFVAVALFKKAGTHRKTEKAERRQEKVLMGSVAQSGRASGFYPEGCQFDSDRTHHEQRTDLKAQNS
jgi:hypothetical protein